MSVHPYQFEPEVKATNELVHVELRTASIHEQQELNEWCSCGCCYNMISPRENVCCHDINEIVQKCTDLQTVPPCITLHEAFEPAIMNHYTLRIAYFAFRDEFGGINDINRWSENEQLRYTAYRQFSRWIYCRLGRHIRKIIPSCVVSAIKRRFPSESYCGYINV